MRTRAPIAIVIDHRTSSPDFQHQYGILRDDYTPKPAFEVYRELVRRLSRR